ncbi:hypothetical protein [Moorena sp. SIO3I6]|uniref:hypothetical protein n=1 Tax=Moorena sp. SIO3I6 TaxID=2607831 RepID=UPI0013FA78C8|nr:hypothetical protein [Moorena sp. SIO3I6]NEP24311.1 hypothetical protein [Moorena sp. SIO3I6]
MAAILLGRRYAMKRSQSVAYGLSFRAYAIAFGAAKLIAHPNPISTCPAHPVGNVLVIIG